MDNKYFSIDDIQEVATEDSVEFAVARIAVLSTKKNSHNVNITKEILKRDGLSVLGKWVIADYDGIDVTTHTKNTHIIGIVPSDSNVEFVENSDGTVTMFVDAILSKLYATEVYNLFRQHNFRNVSVEMSTFNDRENDDNSIDIDGLNIYSICVLGLTVGGSCPDANMSITRFSEKNAEEYYQNTKRFSLKQLAEQRNEKLKVTSHPIDKSKEAVDMGSWDGDKAKDDLLKEKNFKTVAKSVCLLLEDGWEDGVKGALKYPVMNLKNGKWVYNAQGLSSARAYGEQHDPSVADKAISIQKRLGLYKDNDSSKEENMENKEMNFSDSEKDKDIIMEKEDNSADEKDMACDNKEMAGESEDEKLKEEKKEEKDIKDEEKKMAEESEDEKLKEEKKEEDDIAKEEKKFSLDAYVDEAAMIAMLENETEECKALVEKITKEFSANDIVSKFIEMAKENAELKAEKEKVDTEKRDKKFASIMASVKEDLDEKTYSELSEEGKDLSLAQLGAFENKVKAFAYEATKNNVKDVENNDEIMRFGSANNDAEIETDVFVRISKM